MGATPQLTRRLKLRHVAFLLLLLSGAIPLAITNWLLIAQNRELLITEEKSFLTSSAQSLSRELDDYLARNPVPGVFARRRATKKAHAMNNRTQLAANASPSKTSSSCLNMKVV